MYAQVIEFVKIFTIHLVCIRNQPTIYVHVLGLPVEISEDQNVYNQLPKV